MLLLIRPSSPLTLQGGGAEPSLPTHAKAGEHIVPVIPVTAEKQEFSGSVVYLAQQGKRNVKSAAAAPLRFIRISEVNESAKGLPPSLEWDQICAKRTKILSAFDLARTHSRSREAEVDQGHVA